MERKTMTQISDAKKGILTDEMKHVAEIEGVSQDFILKSKEKLDINTLQGSFDELCNVHDMLRAKYSHDENGKAIQEILPTNTQICKIKEHNITENIEKTLKKILLFNQF